MPTDLDEIIIGACCICADGESNFNAALISTATPINGIDSAGIAAILFAATRLVLLVSLAPHFLVAALRLMAEVWCFLMALSWEASLDCIRLETVRTPRAVPISPEIAALKAVLVRMLVVSSARKLAVISSRFV